MKIKISQWSWLCFCYKANRISYRLRLAMTNKKWCVFQLNGFCVLICSRQRFLYFKYIFGFFQWVIAFSDVGWRQKYNDTNVNVAVEIRHSSTSGKYIIISLSRNSSISFVRTRRLRRKTWSFLYRSRSESKKNDLFLQAELCVSSNVKTSDQD